MRSHPPRINHSTAKALGALASVGLVLALAACTDAPDPGDPTPPPVTAPGPGASSGGPGAVAELGYLDAEALKAAVEQWAGATEGTEVSGQQQLHDQLPAAQKWLEGITVVPAECGLYGMGNLKEQLAKATMAAAVLPPSEGGDLTVAAYRERDALVAEVAAQQHLDESCGTYAVATDGQKITSTLTRLEATSSAPYTSVSRLASVNGTTKSRSISVRAIDGHVMVTATRTVKVTDQEATTRALADVESMLSILRGTQPSPPAAP